MECKCLKCAYKWDYQGDSKVFASCPQCRTSVKLPTAEAWLGRNKK